VWGEEREVVETLNETRRKRGVVVEVKEGKGGTHGRWRRQTARQG